MGDKRKKTKICDQIYEEYFSVKFYYLLGLHKQKEIKNEIREERKKKEKKENYLGEPIC